MAEITEITDDSEDLVFVYDDLLQYWEVELVKSNLISLASCEEATDSPCQLGRAPSCPDKADQEIPDSDKNPKTRKFKKIPLPHWLTKPHRKSSQDASNKSARHVSMSKKRMMRANSAPKSLGATRLNLKEHQRGRIIEDYEPGAAESQKKISSPNLLAPKPVLATKRETVRRDRESLWRRRASLPSNVGHVYHNELKKSPHFHQALTPTQERKQFIPTEKVEKDVVKALLFGKATAGHVKHATKLPANPNELKTTKPIDAKREIIPDRVTKGDVNNNSASIHSNNNHGNSQTVPKLQLHCLDTPDMFFVPVIDEEGRENLSRKLSASADELHIATRIDPEEDENESIQGMIARDLKQYLQEREFAADVCQQWCLDLSQSIKTAVMGYKGEDYKVVCAVYIGALRGSGVHASVQCMLTPCDDNFASADYRNQSLYAFASVMIMRVE